MSYKIAIASSDEKKIDLSFGAAKEFLIYEVRDDNTYTLSGRRKWTDAPDHDNAGCSPQEGCSPRSGCGTGGCSPQSGCGGAGSPIAKLTLVDDCRCVICKKIGFQVRKQLEKKAITAFDIEIEIDDALKKIVSYFDKIDNHRSLRGIANQTV